MASRFRFICIDNAKDVRRVLEQEEVRREIEKFKKLLETLHPFELMWRGRDFYLIVFRAFNKQEIIPCQYVRISTNITDLMFHVIFFTVERTWEFYGDRNEHGRKIAIGIFRHSCKDVDYASISVTLTINKSGFQYDARLEELFNTAEKIAMLVLSEADLTGVAHV